MPQTGVVHRLRSLYERAIRHPSARHCVAIWRSYMKFEVETGDPRQAKAIFYQSLQSCAWAKVRYLLTSKLCFCHYPRLMFSTCELGKVISECYDIINRRQETLAMEISMYGHIAHRGYSLCSRILDLRLGKYPLAGCTKGG